MEKVLSRRHYVGYAFGDLANGLSFGMSSTFLLVFYTDVLGIMAAAAGTLFLVARMIDAFTDPLMGAVTDKIFQRRMLKAAGKRIDKFRPFILYGSLPVVLASILLFVAPTEMSASQKLVWAYATYISWGMFYTFINIPYGSMAAVMTQHPVERVKLSTSRSLGGAFGAVIDRAVVPLLLAAYADDQAQGFLVAMAALGGLALAGYLICYFSVEEKVETIPEQAGAFDLKQTFGVLWRNRPFLAVSVASLAILTGFGISGAMTVYYFRENLAALDLMSLTGLTVIGPIVLAAIFIPTLIGRFGVHKTVSYSSMMGCIAYAVLFMLPTDPYIFLVGTFICVMFLIVPMMCLWGMVSDSIDYNQYLSGIRQEGVIYGSYSFVRKTGSAFAGFLAGWGLSLAGYSAESEQTASTLLGIKFLTLGAPAIGLFLASLAFFRIWNLSPKNNARCRKPLPDQTSLWGEDRWKRHASMRIGGF